MKRFDRQYKIKQHSKIYRRNPFIKHSPLKLVLAGIGIVLLIGVGWGIAKAVNKSANSEPLTEETASLGSSQSERSNTDQGTGDTPVVPEYDDREDTFLFLTLKQALKEAELNKGIAAAKAEDVKYLCISLKGKEGKLAFDTEVEAAIKAKAVSKDKLNISQIKNKLEGSKVKLAVDISTFQDPTMAKADKETAVLYKGSKDPWLSDDGKAWLDPTNPKAKRYILDLMDDLYAQGADCVVLSNVQFPKGNKEAQKDTYSEVNADKNILEHLNQFIFEAEEKALEKGKTVCVKLNLSDVFEDTDIYGGSPMELDAVTLLIYKDIKASGGSLDLDRKIDVSDMSEEEINQAIEEAVQRVNTNKRGFVLFA